MAPKSLREALYDKVAGAVLGQLSQEERDVLEGLAEEPDPPNDEFWLLSELAEDIDLGIATGWLAWWEKCPQPEAQSILAEVRRKVRADHREVPVPTCRCPSQWIQWQVKG